MAGQRGHGGLAIGAGNREHRLAVVPGEQLDVAEHRDVRGDRGADDFFLERQPRTDANQIDALQQAALERPEVQLALKVCSARWRGPRIGDARVAALMLDPARRREAAVAQAQHENAFSRKGGSLRNGQKRKGRLAHHLSLSVDRPKSTSIMVMIQKRTTTWLSFQPSSS